MKTIEITAKTAEEAIEIALKELDAERGEVEVDVVSQGKAGILGFGSELAKVRVTLLEKPPDLVEVTTEILQDLLAKMKVDAQVSLSRAEPDFMGGPLFAVEGEDSGLLIGRRGETLKALQFLVNFLARRQLGTRTNIMIDVAGYQQKRIQSLTSLARRVAQRVDSTGRSIALEPMPANERRIVHLVLADNPRVATESMGTGDSRQVVVLPEEDAQPRFDDDPQDDAQPRFEDDPADAQPRFDDDPEDDAQPRFDDDPEDDAQPRFDRQPR